MDIMQTGTVLAIVVITYLIGAAAKLIPHIKDEYIPVIVGAAGGVLGIAGMYCSEFSIGQNLCARRAACCECGSCLPGGFFHAAVCCRIHWRGEGA